jgi:hypothetical protein
MAGILFCIYVGLIDRLSISLIDSSRRLVLAAPAPLILVFLMKMVKEYTGTDFSDSNRLFKAVLNCIINEA